MQVQGGCWVTMSTLSLSIPRTLLCAILLSDLSHISGRNASWAKLQHTHSNETALSTQLIGWYGSDDDDRSTQVRSGMRGDYVSSLAVHFCSLGDGPSTGPLLSLMVREMPLERREMPLGRISRRLHSNTPTRTRRRRLQSRGRRGGDV